MGCRCTERAADLNRAIKNLTAGRVRDAAKDVAHAGRTFVEDAKAGEVKRAIGQRLAAMRRGR
jgi:hypothetical protein